MESYIWLRCLFHAEVDMEQILMLRCPWYPSLIVNWSMETCCKRWERGVKIIPIMFEQYDEKWKSTHILHCWAQIFSCLCHSSMNYNINKSFGAQSSKLIIDEVGNCIHSDIQHNCAKRITKHKLCRICCVLEEETPMRARLTLIRHLCRKCQQCKP